MPPSSAARTFGQLIEQRLRRDPGRPLVTFYDDETGERTELSATTYANWVAKTAGVLVEDLDLAPGDRLRIDLPTHWLGPVFLGAAWTAGTEVVSGAADAAYAAVVGGPGTTPDLFCALLPFAVRARGPLPGSAQDFGVLWPGQPDAFLGVPGSAGDAAYAGLDQRSLLASVEPDEARVLTDVVPTSPEGVRLFLATLLGGGSVVWVAHPAPERWAERATSERAARTDRLDAQPPRS